MFPSPNNAGKFQNTCDGHFKCSVFDQMIFGQMIFYHELEMVILIRKENNAYVKQLWERKWEKMSVEADQI